MSTQTSQRAESNEERGMDQAHRINVYMYPGIPTTIKINGCKHNHHCWTLRVLIIEIGSTIILMAVEAQGVW